jgi:uncharacterized phage-associated protein
MTLPPLTAALLSRALLELAEAAGRPVTLHRLQLLCFITHGYCLALCHYPLIAEPFLALDAGPRLASLSARWPLSGPAAETTPWLGALPADGSDVGGEVQLTGEWSGILRLVWQHYGRYSDKALSSLVQRPGTPWATVHGAGGGVIPDGVTRAFYQALATP